MRRQASIVLRCLTAAWAACAAARGEEANVVPPPEARAMAYLAAEVPKWHRENRCYSCHNNGDAVRALAAGRTVGLLKDAQPLADSLEFLAAPQKWDANGPDGPFKDRDLARLQFGAALTAVRQARLVGREPIGQAAALVAELQQADGGWPADGGASVGSPTTYGRALATTLALQTLAVADGPALRDKIARGRAWCRQQEVKSVLDAGAILWALADDDSFAAREQRRRCLQLIAEGESSEGGWGPFVNSPPEVFDTALVILALAAQRERPAHAAALTRGRKFLVATQAADGSWPATTRPRGGESYAQQVSTTGWATLALLVTRAR
jgi:hypothetical protein